MGIKIKKKIINGLDFAVFTFPALIMVLIATNIPFILNLYYALFDWNGVSRSMKFVGLNNFIRIFTIDAQFSKATFFTLRFAIFYLFIVNVIAIIFALMLARVSLISSIGRSCYYIPNIISLIAVGFIWKFIFGPGFDYLYTLTGLEFYKLSWMGSSKLAFYSVLIVTIWQNSGFYMIIYIAGILGIPKDVIEAAEIDGSRGIGHFFRITLPLIMPSVTVCIFTSLTYAFKLFDIVLVFTMGGPGGSTETVAYNIYAEAFKKQRYGLATAKSVVFFMVVLIVTAIQLVIFKKREVEV